LSPFAIDQREFSVGDYRKLALAQTPGLPEMATHDQRPACHYRGVDDTSADDMPLNCVTREQARDLCALLDKRLPTEAEWEFAAGSDEELELPWGHGEPCEFAVVGRGPTSEVAAELEMPQGNTACLEDDAPASEQGPVALASFEGGVPDGLRDVTESGIAYLGGNLSEWVEDMAVPYWEDCWSVPGTPLYDPVCDTANDEGIVRGGSFVDPPYYARTYARGRASLSGEAAPAVGFRCARSDGL